MPDAVPVAPSLERTTLHDRRRRRRARRDGGHLRGRGDLVGVVTRRDLLDLDTDITARVGDLVRRTAVVIYDDSSAREAADHMVHDRVGRLPVVSRRDPRRVIGIVSRSDLLKPCAEFGTVSSRPISPTTCERVGTRRPRERTARNRDPARRDWGNVRPVRAGAPEAAEYD